MTFKEYISHRISLSTEEEHKVLELPRRLIAKGDFVLKEGTFCTSFYFCQKGLFRLYFLDENGNERTGYFYSKGEFISAYASFVKGRPSRFYVQALEDSEIIEIDQRAAQDLLSFSPKFDLLARIAMEEEMIAQQEILEALIAKSAEERYEMLFANEKDLFKRVPQKYLASYIGVRPESMSRIKKRVFG